MDTASFEFEMDDGHAVDQEKKIAASVVEDGRGNRKFGLLCYLVGTLSGGNLLTVVNFKADFLSEVDYVVRVVAFNGYGFSVYESIEVDGSFEKNDLFKDLLHFSVG